MWRVCGGCSDVREGGRECVERECGGCSDVRERGSVWRESVEGDVREGVCGERVWRVQ